MIQCSIDINIYLSLLCLRASQHHKGTTVTARGGGGGADPALPRPGLPTAQGDVGVQWGGGA